MPSVTVFHQRAVQWDVRKPSSMIILLDFDQIAGEFECERCLGLRDLIGFVRFVTPEVGRALALSRLSPERGDSNVAGHQTRGKTGARGSGGESEGSDVVEKGLDLGAIG